LKKEKKIMMIKEKNPPLTVMMKISNSVFIILENVPKKGTGEQ